MIKRLFSRDIGKINEDIAQDYLKKHGLKPIAANFSCRYGELDLIMNDADVLVFVEVKYRNSRAFGGAINAITLAKQRKLVKTAQLFMQQNQLSQQLARFDVVAIQGNGQASPDPEIIWIKNAFYAE